MAKIMDSYTSADASFEIILMLAGAFVLGFILAWLLKPSKQYVKTIITPSKGAVKEKQKKKDDLQVIEGIGPKIEKHLRKHDIYSFEDIVDAGIEKLQNIMEKGGSRLAMHSPATWSDQAQLAHDQKWSELEEYQEILNTKKKKKKKSKS